MHAAIDSMATLTSKNEEFVQVNSIETRIGILSCLSNTSFWSNRLKRSNEIQL